MAIGVVTPQDFQVLVAGVIFVFQISLVNVLVQDVPEPTIVLVGMLISPLI